MSKIIKIMATSAETSVTLDPTTCGICSNPLSGEFFIWSINGGEYSLCKGCNERIEGERNDAIAAGHDPSTLPQALGAQQMERPAGNLGSSTMRLPDPDALRPIEPVAPVKDYASGSQFAESAAKSKGGSAPLYILVVLVLGVAGCVAFLLMHH